MQWKKGTLSPEERLPRLIRVLENPEAEPDARDAAAAELAFFDEPEAEAALLRVGAQQASPDLADRCGESLAERWSRDAEFPADRWRTLAKNARETARRTLRTLRPDWPDPSTHEKD